MVGWIIAASWLVGFLITSRYAWWFMSEEFFCGSLDDPDEYVMAAMMFMVVFLAWPLILVGIVVRALLAILAKTPVKTFFKWFYARGREERKKVLRHE